MAIVLSGTTNDITVNGVSVATDAEVSYAITDAVQTGLVALQTIATGTATFTATTNNINLTGIGVGVEIGDVIQISGAEDVKNNSEFTIEVITDANNIIVNQAHANKGTSKNVAARASDTGVTVKLLAKWYNAPIGLGQGWVDVTSTRALDATYTNSTGKSIMVFVTKDNTGNSAWMFYINGVSIGSINGYGTNNSTSTIIPKGSTYMADTLTGILLKLVELR